MAKKRRKSSKCPEPFNTLIDLAQAFTLDYVAHKRRQKRGGQRNRIDPYEATGIAMGMGLIDDTEDLIKFGGVLGAIGAFDDDEPSPCYRVNDNRYAWRLNCEDGSEYDISPFDYEMRAEYNEALMHAKEPETTETIIASPTPKNADIECDIPPLCSYIICRVSRLDNGTNRYYKTTKETYKIGDAVAVETDDGSTAQGIILSVERHSAATLPISIDEMPNIVE